MSDTLFDKFYNISADAKKLLVKPFVANKVKRAFDAAIDSLEESKAQGDASVQDIQTAIANGDTDAIKRLLEVTLRREEYDKLLVVLQEQKEEFFG